MPAQVIRLQIAVVVGIVVGAVSATLYISNIGFQAELRDQVIITKVETIQLELSGIRKLIAQRTIDRWHLSDQLHWTNRLQELNKALIVPRVGERSPLVGDEND